MTDQFPKYFELYTNETHSNKHEYVFAGQLEMKEKKILKV